MLVARHAVRRPRPVHRRPHRADPARGLGRGRRAHLRPSRDQAGHVRAATGDRGWLAKVRPWWGHDAHFHVRLACPAGEPLCRDQEPPPGGDGCGADLAWWLSDAPGSPSRLGHRPSRSCWPTCRPNARPCSEHVEQIEQDDHRVGMPIAQSRIPRMSLPPGRSWPRLFERGTRGRGSGRGRAVDGGAGAARVYPSCTAVARLRHA